MPRGVYHRTDGHRRAISKARAGRSPGPNERKFWAKVDRSSGPDACWPWLGHLNEWGYGQTWFRGKPCLAHRKAYALEVGEIPNTLLLLHSCDNPRCCNPKHHVPGTNAENMADMSAKGRARISKLSQEQVRAALDEIEGGASPSEVTDRLGVTRGALHYWMRKLGRRVGPVVRRQQ
jgi:hypothetical protein